MDILLSPVPILILAYLAGSIPFGLVVTRLAGAGEVGADERRLLRREEGRVPRGRPGDGLGVDGTSGRWRAQSNVCDDVTAPQSDRSDRRSPVASV